VQVKVAYAWYCTAGILANQGVVERRTILEGQITTPSYQPTNQPTNQPSGRFTTTARKQHVQVQITSKAQQETLIRTSCTFFLARCQANSTSSKAEVTWLAAATAHTKACAAGWEVTTQTAANHATNTADLSLRGSPMRILLSTSKNQHRLAARLDSHKAQA
jgi:hypothetical protein